MLENDLRQAIVETLEATPGLNKNQLSRAVGTSFRVARYHIQILEDAGLILELDSAQGNEGLFFVPEDAHLWDDERTRILFGREGARRIALYVADHPGATTDEIADAFNLTTHAARWHTQVLQEHRLVVKARLSRDHYEYHPTTLLTAWARDVGSRYEGTEDWIGART